MTKNAAQRRRWTFYEAINIEITQIPSSFRCRKGLRIKNRAENQKKAVGIRIR